MERVKVVKVIPGILDKGDILISPVTGADFCLEETKVTSNGSSERYISLDYVTVSENIPEFFVFEQDEELDSECYFCGECNDCDCTCTEEQLKELGIEFPSEIVRTDTEIEDRYNYFKQKFEDSYPGTEAQVVYRNLMWFVEWLHGKAEII